MKKHFLLLLFTIILISSCQDKKVINAFGYMNEKLEESNHVLSLRNEVHQDVLHSNIEKEPEKYKSIKSRSDKVIQITNDFYNYLEDVKDKIYNAHFEQGEDRNEYIKLSSSDFIDELFFINDESTAEGQQFTDKVNRFKIDIASALSRGFASISSIVNSRFRTETIKGRKGKSIPWLNFKFKGFPAITSIANISQMQTDIKLIESELLLSMISGEFERELAMRNFVGIVQLNKNAYLEGEIVKGKILLGRYDTSVTPENVIVNGTRIDKKFLKEGEISLNFKAGGLGEHPLAGVFTVMEEGEPVQIRFDSGYSVIRKYQFDGSNPDNPIIKTTPKASAPTKKTPEPVAAFDETKVKLKGTIRGDKFGYITISNRMLSTSTIGALHYESNKKYKATSFSIKIDGNPALKIKGNKLNARAKKALKKARKGQRIKIYNIKVMSSSGGRLSNIEPIVIKIK